MQGEVLMCSVVSAASALSVFVISLVVLNHAADCSFAIQPRLAHPPKSTNHTMSMTAPVHQPSKSNPTTEAPIPEVDYYNDDDDDDASMSKTTRRPLTREQLLALNMSWYYLAASSVGLSVIQFVTSILFLVLWNVFFRKTSWIRTGINVVLLLGIAICSFTSLALSHPDHNDADMASHEIMLAFTTLLCMNMIIMCLTSCCSLQYTLSKPCSTDCSCDWKELQSCPPMLAGHTQQPIRPQGRMSTRMKRNSGSLASGENGDMNDGMDMNKPGGMPINPMVPNLRGSETAFVQQTY